MVDSILSFISSVLVSANTERNSLFSTFKSAILNNFCSNRWVFAIIIIANKTKKMINLQCFIASSSIKNLVRNMLYNPPFIFHTLVRLIFFLPLSILRFWPYCFVQFLRSEEHTSELQSRENL